jgi:hypothetical protein
MKNASNPQACSGLNEHRGVVYKNGLSHGGLGKIERKPKDLDVRLSHSNETGRDEGVHNPV